MSWVVEIGNEFKSEFFALQEDVRAEIPALARLLQQFSDTKRKAILLVAGDKSGVGEKRFYHELIRKADDRFDAHLARMKKERK